MHRSHQNLIGAATGVAGSTLTFVGLMLTNAATDAISITDAPATVAATYDAHRDAIRGGVSLALIGTFLLIAFIAQLADRIRQGEAGRSWLGAIVFGGGLAGIAGLLVYLALLVAATDSAILAMPESARTLLLLSWEYGGVLAPAFAALVGGVSVARTRGAVTGIPRPVAWLGLLLTVALALGGFYGGALVVLSIVWLCAVALCLLVEAAVAPHRRLQLA